MVEKWKRRGSLMNEGMIEKVMVEKKRRVKRRGGEQKKYERAAIVGEGGRRWRGSIF